MSEQLQPVRGTHDLLPDDMRRHRRVSETARLAAECFGFQEIATPIFEFTEVFKRTIGDTTDIVTKEMYTFTDRGGETITLRPEGTASVARAFISGGLAQHVPLKYFYSGPMFRYERPQKGRLRQFHQTGVELLGVADPLGDVEIIAVGVEFLRRIGVWERCYLEVNSLGDAESRKVYRDVLVSYLSSHKDKLSKDSVERLERNPMRILDSKDEGDRQIVADAPVYSDHLNQASKDFFSRVLEGLDAIGIPHAINPRLVRGLDYYCHTCFEIISDDLGAQGTVMGGGRYDGLVSIMGGPETPGVGWASGVERCMMLLRDEPKARRPIALVPIGADAERQALILADRIRQAGLPADLGYSGNMGKRMKRANKLNARVAIILGETELSKNVAAVRDLDSGEQREVALDALIESLARHQ
jgi:histidyl-tRNA synthetase